MGTIRRVMQWEAPLERVFGSWEDPERLARAFGFFESVDAAEDRFVFHYVGLMGKTRMLEVLVTERVDEKCIAWRGGPKNVGIVGSVAFEPKGAATYVTFVVGWRPPLGRFGEIVGDWLSYPKTAIDEGLERMATIATEPLE